MAPRVPVGLGVPAYPEHREHHRADPGWQYESNIVQKLAARFLSAAFVNTCPRELHPQSLLNP
jgi:hypothetical protein